MSGRVRKDEDEDAERGVPAAAKMVQGWGPEPTLTPLVEALRKTPLALVAVLSKRRGAKSHLLKCLLYRLVCERIIRLDSLLVVSATSELNRAYDWVPSGQVVSSITEEKLDRIIRFQCDRVERAQARARNSGRAQTVPGLVLVLDDIAGSGINLQQSPSFRFLCLNGRHCRICCFVLAQQVKGLFGSAGIRQNLDLVLSGVLAISQQKAAWEVSVGMKFQDFSDLLASMPAYSFLQYSNLSEAHEQRWALVRAPAELPRFRLGRPMCKKRQLAQDKARLRKPPVQQQPEQ